MYVLVIDDDPTVALLVKELLPDAVVLAAKDGLEGLTYVCQYHALIRLVVLDIRMPYNGVNVAVRLRYEFPALRILPYSYCNDKAGLLRSIGGIAPLVPKPAHPAVLAQRLREALEMPAPEPPNTTEALLHIRQEAIQQAVERQRDDAGVALLSNVGFLRLLQPALLASRQLWVGAFSHAQCSELLDEHGASVLLADTGSLRTAQGLAGARRIPLLVVAFSVAEGYRGLYVTNNVMLWQEDASRLLHALDCVRAGRSYTDPLITDRLSRSGLSSSERAMVPFLLHDVGFVEISRALHISVDTARKYRSNITTTLGCATVGELTEYLNQPEARP